jgi:asparagine synthase (glutamine-hydrolysing)
MLPSEVFTRKKMGFSVPLDYWFRNELRDLTRDTLLSANAKTHAFFRPESVQKLFAEHDQRYYDHSARLWALVMLEMWMREWASA